MNEKWYRSAGGWRRAARIVAVLVLGGFVTTGCGGGKESPAAPAGPRAPTPSPSVYPGKTKIGEMKIESVTQGWGTPQLDKSVIGSPLTIAGASYNSGIGTHAQSIIEVSFPPNFKTLSGACGVDGFVKNNGSIVCKVVAGDKVLFTSPLLKGGMKASAFSVPVGGLSKLTLVVEDGGDNITSDHADWVDLSLK
jgi:hypothetical protein